MTHHFLFHEGQWVGSGEVEVPLSSESIQFQTKWTVSPLDEQRFRAIQHVEIIGQESMVNTFTITKKLEGEFHVFLENESLGVFSGDGVSDENQLAWEFAHYGSLEGMEVYERTKEDAYSFRGEYLASNGDTTTIRGSMVKMTV